MGGAGALVGMLYAVKRRKEANTVVSALTDEQWGFYNEMGYVKIGRTLTAPQLDVLRRRIDMIMLGRAKGTPLDQIMMQLDSGSGKYNDAGEQTFGHKGPTLNYREIQKLERDRIFLEYMRQPVFQSICEQVYGSGAMIASFRAMFST